MLCDQCGKKPASVHITKVENGKKTEMHLCEQCAVENNQINLNASFSINDLLTGLLNTGSVLPIKVDYIQDVKCGTCGLSYNQFKETGRFGCGNCYKTFGERLNPLFKKVHGNINHTGKIPNRAGSKIKLQREIEKLKLELEAAIRSEEYEKAALIRDSIRELNKTQKEESK